jgi:hypothetical protein
MFMLTYDHTIEAPPLSRAIVFGKQLSMGDIHTLRNYLHGAGDFSFEAEKTHDSLRDSSKRRFPGASGLPKRRYYALLRQF